jgi:hypothetical protein
MNINLSQLRVLNDIIDDTAKDIELEKVDSILRIRVEYTEKFIAYFELDEQGNKINAIKNIISY